MDGDELRELQMQVKENNKMLKKMQSRARWATFGSILKYVVYIAIVLASYYYIQPYIDAARDAVDKVQEAAGTVQDIKEKTDNGLSSILDRFNFHDGGELDADASAEAEADASVE